MQSCSLPAAGDAPISSTVLSYGSRIQLWVTEQECSLWDGIFNRCSLWDGNCDERGAAGLKIAREGQDCQVNACFPSDLGKDATPPKAVLCAVNSRCDTQIKCCPSWVLVGESLQIQGAVTSLFCGRSLSSQFMS